jgi:hypothetical protein
MRSTADTAGSAIGSTQLRLTLNGQLIWTHPKRIGYADQELPVSANMDREVFLDHLLRASAHCREFTTRLVFDSLPGR